MDNHTPTSTDDRAHAGPLAPGRADGLFFWVCLAYFAAKAIFFALGIRERVFPDETSWLKIAQLFSRAAWLPVDSPESYPFGLVTHMPNLYFFLMGKALLLNCLPVSDLIFLRLVNVIIALMTVTCAWRLARAVAATPAVRALFLVMLTNTVMFTFVAGSINNDNLAALLAVLALYHQVRFFQGRSLGHGLLSALFLLAGTLTKSVFLPYALALLLVALVHERGRLLACLKAWPGRGSTWRWRERLLGFLCLGALAANLLLYGGNELRYGFPLPTMDKVLPLESCLQNRLFTRDYVVREFKNGHMSMLEAQRQALRIRDPGDRASAWSQLAEAEKRRHQGQQPLMSRWRYSVEWFEVIVSRTYSVAAHLSLFKYASAFYPYYALFAVAGVMWLCRFPALLVPGMAGVGFVALFYTVFLMQVVGYMMYSGSGFSGVAMTGRYMFPALAALYLATAHGLLAKMPRWWQVGIGVAVGLFFIWGEFPWFVRQAGAEWYF